MIMFSHVDREHIKCKEIVYTDVLNSFCENKTIKYGGYNNGPSPFTVTHLCMYLNKYSSEYVTILNFNFKGLKAWYS